MGLDISHDAFHGAYSAFNRFRRVVAKATGGCFPPHSEPNVPADHFQIGDGYGPEESPGLWEFLIHSDCDGEIAPNLAAKLADEMELLLPEIEKLDDGGGGHISRDGGYVAVAKRLITACRNAAEANEPLIFN